MAFMAKAKTVMAFVAMVALIDAADVAAQSTDCDTAIQSLLPCLAFVQGKVPEPSADCCKAFADVVKTKASCLCSVLSGNAGGIQINVTKALELPKLCSVATPDLSSCYTDAPAPSPFPLPGAPAPDAGAVFAPSMVAVVSMAALVLMKILS